MSRFHHETPSTKVQWEEAIYRKRSLFWGSLHCKMKWLKLLPQNLPWLTLSSFEGAIIGHEGGKSHLCLRMGKEDLEATLCDSPCSLKESTVELLGCLLCGRRLQYSCRGSVSLSSEVLTVDKNTVLSALQNPHVFNLHVEVDSPNLSIITFHLETGSERLRNMPKILQLNRKGTGWNTGWLTPWHSLTL